MITEYCNGKYVEGSGRGQFEKLFCYLPAGTEEDERTMKHGIPLAGI
jgi:hypothetical protein